jgi:glycosyltransferase involved in cell wall biosynthesis
VAQEREKRRIVIASILKPTDDTRMFEKMGQTIAQTANNEVSIIGFEPSGPALQSHIQLISLGRFPRLSLQRLLARWRVLRIAYSLKPTLFIFTTHELILPAVILKVVFNTRIIYDVRENYFRNILHSEGLPWFARAPLAMMVRLKEKLSAPAIDHFFLAEQGYEQEFKFHRGGWTVIENKSLPYAGPRSDVMPTPGLKLLFSGTLSESTGVFRAIHLAKELHRVRGDVQLTIAGYASSQSVRDRIRKETADAPFIHLIGIDALVPHPAIAALILSSDAGIIAYTPSPHTRNAVPTKLFEYLHAGLPILTETFWHWIPRYEVYQPFVFCDYEQLDPDTVIKDLTTSIFYITTPENVSWSSEAPKLLAATKI